MQKKAPTTTFWSLPMRVDIHSAGDGLWPDPRSLAPNGRVEFP